MPYTNNNGQTRVGIRSGVLVAQTPSASTLWNSIYAVYNGDSVGSQSLKTSLYAVYNGESNTNDSFGTNNGTAQGGLTYGTGKIGNAFQFNGTNAYVSLPTDSLNSLTGDFSLSFWMNLTNSHSSNGGMIFSNLQFPVGITTYYGFQIGFYNGQIYFIVGSNTGVSTASTRLVSNTLSGYIGTWVHVTCTHKQSTGYKIYVNGVLNNSNNGTYNPVYTTNHTPSIGAQYSVNASPNLFYPLNGKLDALNVWNRELTASEITELYNSGNGAQYITDNFYKPTPNDALLVNNGTAVGGLTWGVGKVGTAFQFNGSNAYVSLPNNSLNSLTGDFSVSCWVYLSALTTRQGFIGNYIYVGGGADIKGFRVYYGASGTGNVGGVRIDIGDGSNPAVSLLSNNYLTLNTWYHVVVTRKSSTGTKIYINGTQSVSNTSTMNPSYSTTYPSIGVAKSSVSTFDWWNSGKMDAISIWNKELTATEVTELYNSGNGKQYSN